MAIELVTGRAAELHVSSEDDRLLHCRIYGEGAYVLSGCEVTMTTANKCHIADGELMVQGAFVRITEGGVDVAVTNGTSGQMRNTIIALQYNRDDDGIESMSFAAVNGANSTSAPADPTIVTNDINAGATSSAWKFARLQLDGLTVGTPEVLFKEGEAFSTFRDSISQLEEGTASFNGAWSSSNARNYVTKAGKMVEIGLYTLKSSEVHSGDVVCTLPDGFRPKKSVGSIMVASGATKGTGIASVEIRATGEVVVGAVVTDQSHDAWRWIIGNAVFLVV